MGNPLPKVGSAGVLEASRSRPQFDARMTAKVSNAALQLDPPHAHIRVAKSLQACPMTFIYTP
jgi:hypothetical protein